MLARPKGLVSLFLTREVRRKVALGLATKLKDIIKGQTISLFLLHHLYSCPSATVTKYHELGDLNNKCIVS